MIESIYKDISEKQLEELAKQIDFYPVQVFPGTWRLSSGIYTNDKGLELIYKEIDKEIKTKILKK